MRLIPLILLVFLCGCTPDHGTWKDPREDYIYGTVVGITDGDAFTLLTPAKEQGKIRLAIVLSK